VPASASLRRRGAPIGHDHSQLTFAVATRTLGAALGVAGELGVGGGGVVGGGVEGGGVLGGGVLGGVVVGVADVDGVAELLGVGLPLGFLVLVGVGEGEGEGDIPSYLPCHGL
jgi:hypothetical protein